MVTIFIFSALLLNHMLKPFFQNCSIKSVKVVLVVVKALITVGHITISEGFYSSGNTAIRAAGILLAALLENRWRINALKLTLIIISVNFSALIRHRFSKIRILFCF